MTKKIFSILAGLFVLLSAGCSKDFLDMQPKDRYGVESVWSDLALVETFVNEYYARLANSTNRCMLGVYTDEFQMNPGSANGHANVNKSLVSPSDYSSFGGWAGTNQRMWNPSYYNIRGANLILRNTADREYANDNLKQRIRGEAYFLRAYNYYNLVFFYGGVPLLTEPFVLGDDGQVARSSFEECIDFIARDCDSAAALLPAVQPQALLGRASGGAALALKARVLLHAASDLFHNTSSWVGSYANPELVGIIGGDRTAWWRKARDAAREVIDLGVYELAFKDPAPDDDILLNYQRIMVDKVTSEDIFVRFFAQGTVGNGFGQFDLSTGYRGWANTCPNGKLVDAYEMIDGSKFDWNNPVHAADPYANRDPRLSQHIFYTGAKWRPRFSDLQGVDPIGIINTGYKQRPDGTWEAGLDARGSTARSWEGSYTGYYLRKFLDPAIEQPTFSQECPWRYIRYTEVILSYAEACAELGEEEEARTYLNTIRKRAGMPDVATTGDDLIESVRHERRIELMGEDHRFYDIRRWMIAPQVMNEWLTGVDIRTPLGATTPTYNLIDVEERVWKDSWYFLPISIDEMNKNTMLIQNPLY